MLKELADFADDNGERIFPGNARLAARLDCTTRWVRVVLRKLRARGWLTIARSGGGRSDTGRGRRNIYRLEIPSIPNAQRALPGFPQTCPQNFHNGDLSIHVQRGSLDPPNGDLLIPQAPDPTGAGAASSPVQIEPIRPVLRTSSTTTTDPSSTENARALTEDEQTERARLEGLARVRMLKAQLITTPAPARRRRHGR